MLDEKVHSREDVEALGIMTGDIVCFDPRTTVTESGYIKRMISLASASCLAMRDI